MYACNATVRLIANNSLLPQGYLPRTSQNRCQLGHILLNFLTRKWIMRRKWSRIVKIQMTFYVMRVMLRNVKCDIIRHLYPFSLHICSKQSYSRFIHNFFKAFLNLVEIDLDFSQSIFIFFIWLRHVMWKQSVGCMVVGLLVLATVHAHHQVLAVPIISTVKHLRCRSNHCAITIDISGDILLSRYEMERERWERKANERGVRGIVDRLKRFLFGFWWSKEIGEDDVHLHKEFATKLWYL